MKNLAVETSSKICAVAILENDKLIDEITLDNGKTHSENLMPIMKECLERNKLELKDFELMSVSVGPGSFTGIRIGIASIKPIAEVFNIKIAGVTSLETLAQNAIESNYAGYEKFDNVQIISLIDAKNNQVYAGFYDKDGNSIIEEKADDIFNILENNVKNYNKIIVVGDGAINYKDKIIEFCNQNNIEVRFIENNIQSALNTGKVGYKKFIDGNLKNADTILPIYLRKSQAERLKKD